MIYQLKISLKGLIPPIWRQVQVDNAVTLETLHHIFQTAMGWENAHLYRFVIDGLPYGDPATDGWSNVQPASQVKLAEVIDKAGHKFIYVYDFGDDWQHAVKIEKILPPDPAVNPAIGLAGRRACPPENCGGIFAYGQMLDILQDPTDEAYADVMARLGQGFDPEAFEIVKVLPGS